MTDAVDVPARGAFHRLPPDQTAPRLAREWVREKLQQIRRSHPSLDADAEFDVLLCTSELVNASLLAGSQQMILGLTADSGCVRITLEADTAVPAGTDPVALAQRQCLHIVKQLAQRWGLDATPAGRIGWAEFRFQHVGGHLPPD